MSIKGETPVIEANDLTKAFGSHTQVLRGVSLSVPVGALTVILGASGSVADYSFDFAAFAVSLVVFLAAYELTVLCYAAKIRKTPLKSIMQED